MNARKRKTNPYPGGLSLKTQCKTMRECDPELSKNKREKTPENAREANTSIEHGQGDVMSARVAVVLPSHAKLAETPIPPHPSVPWYQRKEKRI
jgi:hypothetical protein